MKVSFLTEENYDAESYDDAARSYGMRSKDRAAFDRPAKLRKWVEEALALEGDLNPLEAGLAIGPLLTALELLNQRMDKWHDGASERVKLRRGVGLGTQEEELQAYWHESQALMAVLSEAVEVRFQNELAGDFE